MKKIQRIISVIVFVVLLVLAIMQCADILEYKRSKNKYIPFYESETNFDVIFMGTSHMYDHVLPMEMWEEYGIASYNWGAPNCTLAENYYLIQEVLKYTSPEVIVIDMFGMIEYEGEGNGKYRSDKAEQQHVQFDGIPLSKNKIEAVLDIFDDYDGKEDFIWNFIKYHNRWSELGQEDFENNLTVEKGAELIHGLGNDTFTQISEDEKMELNSVCYSYLLKILDYCQEHNITVLCVYNPFGAGESHQRVANSIGDAVEAYPNCEYVNLLTKGILNFDTDICPDNWHLNYSGALKTTKWLGQYLVDNYSLTDYSDNQFWREDYIEYHDFLITTLKEQSRLVDYLVQLADDDFEVEAVIYDENLMEAERLMVLFQNAGISPRLSDEQSKYCAKLSIKSLVTGEKIEDVYFTYSGAEEVDIFNITEVAE